MLSISAARTVLEKDTTDDMFDHMSEVLVFNGNYAVVAIANFQRGRFPSPEETDAVCHSDIKA